MNGKFRLRNAELSDVEALARIERSCWPIEIAGTADDIASRVAAFSSGQFVIEQDLVMGAIYGQRIAHDALLRKLTYERLTDQGRFTSSHVSDGSVYQLVGVSVLAEARGLGFGRLLVDHAVRCAKETAGIERIVGVTRPVDYANHADESISDYIERRTDPVLEFHRAGGALILAGHAGYRPRDADTNGYGVLIEYPM